MKLGPRLKRGYESTKYFLQGLSLEQGATTLGPLPTYLARRKNPDFGRPTIPAGDYSELSRQNRLEGNGFVSGAVFDLALLISTFGPIAVNNPRLAKCTGIALGVKAVGILAGIVGSAIDERVLRYRSENTR